MFLYCFNAEEKDKLINKGMKLIKEDYIGKQKVYVFLFDKNIKFNFDNKNFKLSNKMSY